MNKSLRTTFLLMAPCLALIAMAFYLTRRAAVAPPVATQSGPLRVQIVGVETQKITPVNVYEGYDRRFHLVYDAQGARPKGWGAPITGFRNDAMIEYKFWLERAGKREKFTPSATRISTTGWDKDKKRYFDEIRINTGAVPDDAALKMSGVGQIAPLSLPSYGPPIPFEVTLKKAGQKWEAPSVSKDTGATIQKIEIRKPVAGQTTATITLLIAPGVDTDRSGTFLPQILSPDWSEDDDMTFAASQGGSSPSASSRRFSYDVEWATNKVSKSQRRDLIIVDRFNFIDKWPLELCFPIKKEGKPIFGSVQPLTRPRDKKPLR